MKYADVRVIGAIGDSIVVSITVKILISIIQ